MGKFIEKALVPIFFGLLLAPKDGLRFGSTLLTILV